ncbi:putative quinol monooxygenase [Streptomyces sp. NPDC058417]|uniref:putative quinol monooxygenase n=2 Tax=Streptomyces TaxID=1883 RepID=UPI003659BD8F
MTSADRPVPPVAPADEGTPAADRAAHAPSAAPHRTGEGFRTFLTLRTEGPKASAEAVAVVEAEVDAWIRDLDGFLSSRVHLALDGTAVVHSVAWRDELSARNTYPAGLAAAVVDRLGSAAALRTDLVGGTPSAGVLGPDADRPPGLLCVAVRYVSGHEGAAAMADLLRGSGTWKRHFPGFVSATPYISPDGRTYVNYPQWLDREAFEAYMADERNAAGQPDIGALEVAPPDIVLCTLVSETVATG